MMNKLMKQFLCAFILCFSFMSAYALNSETLPDVKEGVVSLRIKDPTREVGYTVGDVLTRHLILTIKKPYKLIDESLPITGYQKRYRGQPLGIDLSDIKHKSKDHGQFITHDLTLSYQVWTSKTVVKPGALPAEYLHLINLDSKGKEVVKFRIPSFEFNISPIARFGQIKIENDMSKYQGPLLLDNWPEKQRLKVLLSILALSLLGLIYMLGKYTWLPRMGGPFAISYRQIHKLANSGQANSPEALEQAVSSMHNALNITAGNSLFNDNLDAFLIKKPAFNALKTELQQFFSVSNQVFFTSNIKSKIDSADIKWLLHFCRRCRDCERGLIPEPIVSEAKN
jgi:mxaA protein